MYSPYVGNDIKLPRNVIFRPNRKNMVFLECLKRNIYKNGKITASQ